MEGRSPDIGNIEGENREDNAPGIFDGVNKEYRILKAVSLLGEVSDDLAATLKRQLEASAAEGVKNNPVTWGELWASVRYTLSSENQNRPRAGLKAVVREGLASWKKRLRP